MIGENGVNKGSFGKVKRLFIFNQISFTLWYHTPFDYCDASPFIVKAVLSQKYQDNFERPIVYTSRTSVTS